jgi:endonuclease/exonuclease/phosphatase family metal-dependent hydrolase
MNTQSNRAIRRETARSLGEDLLNNISPASLPVVLLGDFNVDPFDPVLNTPPLRCRRSYSTIDDWRNSTATFYNPTWRFLAPADSWRHGRAQGYQEPRPQRTHEQEDSLIDQILFSKSFLQHDRINFCDTGVRIFHSPDLARFTGNGKLSPRRWSRKWAPGVLGVSDHFPICAELALK